MIQEIYTLTSYSMPHGKEWPDRERTWGWCQTEKEAFKAVEINSGDMFEMLYTYCLIEKLTCGIPCTESKQIAWFIWKTNHPKEPWIGKWVKTRQPEWAMGLTGLSL